MRRLPRFFTVIAAALMFAPTLAVAQDDLPPAFDDEPAASQPVETDTINADTLKQELKDWMVQQAPAPKASSQWPSSPVDYDRDRMDELEDRVTALERSQVTEARVREIAREEISKVMVTLRSASGAIKQQAVAVDNRFTGAFDVRPGETLMGYTDPMTGRYVDLTRQQPQYATVRSYSQPVTVYQSPAIEMRMAPMVASQPRRAAFRVTGGPLQRWMAARSGGTCQMINGQMVCN